MVVPHAGYIYSGQVAAYAYSLLRATSYETVILIGPSHYNYFEGFAIPYYQSFETPLGEIEVDTEFCSALAEQGKGVFDFMNTAHVREHSLEVQLPFLQTVMKENFKIIPILMGAQNYRNAQYGAETLAEILKNYEKHYTIVISTDLSHYHGDAEARKMDAEWIALAEQMNAKRMLQHIETKAVEACGAGPVATFLETAHLLGKTNYKTLVYKNSGDTSGDTSRVVGYASAAVW